MIQKIDQDNSLLLALNINDFRDYLIAIGWNPIDHSNKKIMIFESPSDESNNKIEVVLPAKESYRDKLARLAEAINIIALVEEKSPYEIVNKISQLNRDVLKMAVLDQLSSNNSISLELASKLITKLRNLISYAAITEESLKPYIRKVTNTGIEHVEFCRFGHTFSGSFGFTVESPIPIQKQITLVENASLPFERRVMERIYKGIILTQKAVDEKSENVLVDNYETGLNSNMCETLLNMLEEVDGTTLNYSAIWAPGWPLSDEVFRNPIKLRPLASQYLRGAARQLRGVDTPTDVEINGTVIELRSEFSPFDEEGGEGQRIIKIYWQKEPAVFLKVRVPLKTTDYLIACDAHMQGHAVFVTGQLRKVGSQYTLFSPRNFQIQTNSN